MLKNSILRYIYKQVIKNHKSMPFKNRKSRRSK